MPSQATRPPLAGMPAVWLRDNCPCPLCRDPVSGQRLLHITDIPADIAVAEVVPSGGTVSVLFHPDGHRAVFDRDWLARHADPARGRPPDPRTEDAKRLWSAADLGGEPPRGSWPRYLAQAGYRRACQSAILREGLLLLSDVPTDPGTVLAVAASLGYVRETNYGRLFDVRVESSPSNLAFTSLPIPAHRQPVPRPGADRALLHCLHKRPTVAIRVRRRVPPAAALRAQDPARSHARRHPGHLRIPRRRHGAVRHPAADQPGPLADPGDPDQSAQPSPSGCPGAGRDAPTPLRAAALRRAYADRALRPVTAPCSTHAGAARAAPRRRHLQGCYADLDGVESAVAVGERATTGVIRRKDRI